MDGRSIPLCMYTSTHRLLLLSLPGVGLDQGLLRNHGVQSCQRPQGDATPFLFLHLSTRQQVTVPRSYHCSVPDKRPLIYQILGPGGHCGSVNWPFIPDT